MQDMPTGWYMRRREENGFRPQQAQPYGQTAFQWRQNLIDKEAFLAVLTNRRSSSGTNRGFRVHNSSGMTNVQERTALAYFYWKRIVLADGITAAPLYL